MAATFNESQKIDYLWKKVGYGVTKTAEPASKEAFNESIASPLLYRGDLIWTQSGDIPATPPASTTSLVQVYKDGVGSYSHAVQCTEDLTAPDNQTWKTNSTNWIPTQFGDNYLVQVYAGAANISNPQTAGTKLFGAGSGSDDTWFFDYQSGVLNFNGATIPTAIGTGTANTIYVVGYRYVGEFGVDTTFISNGTSNVNIASSNANVTISVNGTGNVAVFSNTGAYLTGLLSASGNVSGNYILGNGALLTGVVASSANAGDLTGNTLSSNVFYSNLTQVGNLANLSVVGNTSSGNIRVTGFVSATGNVYSNAILSDNYFYANGQPIPTGIVYTANIAPPSGPDIADQWYDTVNDVLYEYITDGVSDYWVDTTSPAFAAGVVANVVISGNMIPVANVTYDIGTSGSYFRTAFLNTVSVSGNVVANSIRSDLITTSILANTTAINLQTNGTNALSIDSNQNITTYKRLPASSMPLGAAVQTVMSNTSGGSSTTATSYTDVTSATVNITLGSSTSKVLVIVSGTSEFTAVSSGNVTVSTRLVRNSTALQQQSYGTSFASGGIAQTSPVGFSYLDSPGTTSPLTYKLQQKTSNSSSTLTSSEIWIVAMEIAAV
jgi:hypothetical protein